jgi:hypothetical protein
MSIEETIKRLTPQQRKAFNRLLDTQKWISSYSLGVGLNTMVALERKKLVKSRRGAGAFSSPQTGILWRSRYRKVE